MTFITWDIEFAVDAPMGAVNQVVADAFRSAGFHIDNQSLTGIEARRGSRTALAWFGGFAIQKAPMIAGAQLEHAARGCQLAVRVGDQWSAAYGAPASWVKSSYRRGFEEVVADIGRSLRKLTPAVTAGEHVERSDKSTGVFGDGIVKGMGEAGVRAVGKAEGVLARDSGKKQGPWNELGSVRFAADGKVAVLGSADVQAVIAAGAVIAMRPGSLPPALADDAERFIARVEHELNGAAGVIDVELTDPEPMILSVLYKQARIREGLPLRTLRECKDCHHRTLVNPDYQKIRKRNEMMRNLSGSFGAGLIKGQLTPFVLVSNVMRFAKLDPDFVCPKCQGMTAEESIVTLCPGCGALQTESMLKVCAQCKHDFLAATEADQLWRPMWEPMMPPPGTPAEWLADPTGRHEFRYWDGHDWTTHVADDGQATTDTIERT